MNGTEIIAFLSSNFPAVMTAVGAVTGSLFTAIFLRHKTSVKEFEKIKAGQFKEVTDELLAAGKMTYTEYYKANNFLKMAKKADEYYAEMPHKDLLQTYDFDWFVRFYEAVGNVSDEEMQDIWAKILASEISESDSFSYRTIDILRNMSRKDAELFVRICSHSFTDGPERMFLPNDKRYLEKCGIQYIDIMRLNEQGLMFNDSTISLSIEINKDQKILLANNELVLTIAATDGKEIVANLNQYPFTESGKELATLVVEHASDDDFIEYGRCLAENKRQSVAIYKVIRWNEDSVEHERTNLITGNNDGESSQE
ncbi:MAG: DUF2806 domain-containing protein [Lachnospiraceae bacterium]|nr:DUF2806 domain-containing protein [Lachnospiraceae bacterium]